MGVKRPSLNASQVSPRSPLLFQMDEDTHNKAFMYASVVVGFTAALTLEYRLKDPFKVYSSRKDAPKDATTANIIQTAVASSLIMYAVLWLFRLLFGLGDSWVLN
jgi:hypothetical protein